MTEDPGLEGFSGIVSMFDQDEMGWHPILKGYAQEARTIIEAAGEDLRTWSAEKAMEMIEDIQAAHITFDIIEGFKSLNYSEKKHARCEAHRAKHNGCDKSDMWD